LARGGYRKPNNPAPVGMPGALSKRTDGGPADTQAPMGTRGFPYGEGREFMTNQQAAPMAATPEGQPVPRMGEVAAAQRPGVIPLNAPGDPNIPITEGASVGPGAGPEILGLPNPEAMMSQDMSNMMKYLPYLELMANSPSSSNSLRLAVKYLKSQA